MIWVGTDDGRVHVTRDGGASWTSVEGNVKGVPANTWVPRDRGLDATPPATAFVGVRRPPALGLDALRLPHRRLRQDLAEPRDARRCAATRWPSSRTRSSPTCSSSAPSSASGCRSTAAGEWTRWSNGVPDRLGHGPGDPAARLRSGHRHARARRSGSSTTSRRCAASGRGPGGEAAPLPGGGRAAALAPAEDGGFGFGATEFRGENRPYGAAITFLASGDELPIADRDRDRERLVSERKAEAAKAAGATTTGAGQTEAGEDRRRQEGGRQSHAGDS